MVYLATNNGLLIVDLDKDWRIVTRYLDGITITAVSTWNESLLAGTKQGIYRSDDQGKTWREANHGLTQGHIRWLATSSDSGEELFTGTEPAAIFHSSDGGEHWQECAEVAEYRDQFHWSLPYSPEAGCVRGFAFHGNRGYAAVEVGGVLRSDDRGQSWRLAEGSTGIPGFSRPEEPLIHPDVHSIETHPSSPELIYAPTGGGFYTSLDGGRTWRCRYVCYARAVWIDPHDASHLILGPADGVSRNGRIEESHDGGGTWRIAADGLIVPWPGHMVERFSTVEEELVAILSNGEVIARPVVGGNWKQVLNEAPGVNALAA